MRTYVTAQGDMFDQIAKRFYGNERRMDALIEANPAHGATAVFSAGTVLVIPKLTQIQVPPPHLPSWRK